MIMMIMVGVRMMMMIILMIMLLLLLVVVVVVVVVLVVVVVEVFKYHKIHVNMIVKLSFVLQRAFCGFARNLKSVTTSFLSS